MTYPLNKFFGRRGAIFISTLCAFLGCIWNGVTNSWEHLFVSRLFLGIGIGPKSATVPTFSAEIAPARIRGALAMQWQTWTAFGAYPPFQQSFLSWERILLLRRLRIS